MNEFIVFTAEAPGGNSDGDWGGVTGADAQCQTSANLAGLSGTYKAWIADSNPNSAPLYRFNNVGTSLPFVRVDGTTVASNWADLVDGSLTNPIEEDENGIASSIGYTSTNVTTSGTRKSTTLHCNDWTDDSNSPTANFGDNNANDATWTDDATGQCDNGQLVYCFEQITEECSNPTRDEGTIIYNQDEKTFQYCNGDSWQQMPHKIGSGSGGCSNPTGDEGDVVYNSSEAVLQGCAGNAWVAIGKNRSGFIPDIVNDLIGHWEMNEDGGTTTADTSTMGNNITGTLTNGAAWTPGHTGSGVSFALNSDDHIDLGTTSLLNISGNMTITAWINPASWGEGNWGTIMARENGNGFNFQLDGGNEALNIWSGNTTDTPSDFNVIDLGVWQHVAVVINGGYVTFYVNGAAAGTASWTLTGAGAAVGAYIGSEDGTGVNFDGAIDDVRIYDRPLYPEEIRLIYGICADPVGTTGQIKYNETFRVPQYCKDGSWVSAGKITDPCLGAPTPGQTCADGTIYAGITEADRLMMTLPCDIGQSWNGVTCVGNEVTLPWNTGNSSGYVQTNINNYSTGQANTSMLTTVDSDSVTGGVQLHEAAQYCADLIEYGHDDWYLPAVDEAYILSAHIDNIGNFSPTQYYWTSSESTGSPQTAGHTVRMSDAALGDTAKEDNWARFTRCVRKQTCDDTPATFTFTDTTGHNRIVASGSLTPIASDIVQITGLGCTASVWVTGTGTNEFRTCSDAACSSVIRAWGTAPTTIANNQYLQVRQSPSGLPGTGKDLIAHIGPNATDTWTITTADNRIAFVTSGATNGGIGSVANANTYCTTTFAASVGLTGTYKAWMASSAATQPSSTFTQPTVPYKRVDGTTVASNWTDLVDGTLSASISVDETGATQSAANNVWTNVLVSGAVETDANGSDCTNWTSSAAAPGGQRGSSSQTSGNWTNAGGAQNCDQGKRYYCFEQ